MKVYDLGSFLEHDIISLMAHITCSAENIHKAVELLKLQGKMIVDVKLNPVRDNTELQERITELGRKYEVSHKTESSLVKKWFGRPDYEEFNATLLYGGSVDECRQFITDVFHFDVDNVYLRSLRNESDWPDEYPQQESSIDLIVNGYLNALIEADSYEPEFYFIMDKSLYDRKTIIRQIEETFSRKLF